MPCDTFRDPSTTGFTGCGKSDYFVIPSEARNLSSIWTQEKNERFLASLGMTKGVGPFFRKLFSLSPCHVTSTTKPDRLKPVLLVL
jgi:hypothetical protein